MLPTIFIAETVRIIEAFKIRLSYNMKKVLFIPSNLYFSLFISFRNIFTDVGNFDFILKTVQKFICLTYNFKFHTYIILKVSCTLLWRLITNWFEMPCAGHFITDFSLTAFLTTMSTKPSWCGTVVTKPEVVKIYFLFNIWVIIPVAWWKNTYARGRRRRLIMEWIFG